MPQLQGIVKSRLRQLNNTAEQARASGDYDRFCQARRDYLLFQAEHYEQLRPQRRRGEVGGG